ncbi:MAG TPA: hypothetical protein VLA13_09565 [Massilibacterium sp.]|nr:hypothetical protein [Massilibacterium sp.]
MIKNLKEKYNPQFFLAALGSGGLGVSFFMYFMFMIPHPDTPMATFNDIVPYLTGDNKGIAVLVALAYLFVIYFAYRHFKLLIWNVREFKLFKQTEAYEKLKRSNGAVSSMAIPLTFAMSINMLFVLGAIFVPNLWNVIEWLLPFAIVAFLIVGYFALKIYIGYFSRFLQGNFDFVQNNHLGQMLAIFAFAMIAVGLAAPAGMSSVMATSAIAMFFSIFFATIAISLSIVKVVLGVRGMFDQGVSKEAGPSLWLMVPIITLLGITFVRLYAGISHNFFNTNPSPFVIFLVLAGLVSLQIIFGMVGYNVLKNIRYFEDYTKLDGPMKSAGSYGLICPGVAFFVLGMFFVGWGLIKTNIVPQFSVYHFIILIPFVAMQIKAIQVLLRLNKKLLKA